MLTPDWMLLSSPENMRPTIKAQCEMDRVKTLQPSVKVKGSSSHRKTSLWADHSYSGQGKKHGTDFPVQGGGYSFGEDSVWVKTFIGENFALTVMMVLDGHGQLGDKASRHVLRSFRHKISSNDFFNVCKNFNEKKQGMMRQYLTKMFHDVEKEYVLPSGGTTVSVSFILSCPDHRHYLITANVGDSPILFLPTDDGNTYMAFRSHSWEEIEERKEYLHYCTARGLTPREVILGRFNTLSGTNIPRMNGDIRPWFMFKKGTAEIDEETMKEFEAVIKKKQQSALGGVQSARKMLMEEFIATENGKVHAIPSCSIPEYSHLNWGSTGYDGFIGRTQMTRSIGDLESKQDLHMRADPDIFIHELMIPEDKTETTFQIVMCSDGVSDLFYFHEFRRILDPTKSSKDLIQDLFIEIYEKTRRLPDFSLDPKHNRPTWDDCSVVVCNLYLHVEQES